MSEWASDWPIPRHLHRLTREEWERLARWLDERATKEKQIDEGDKLLKEALDE